MSIKVVPAHWLFTCDSCEAVEKRDANVRPSTWSHLHLERNAIDYQGIAVADASVHRMLCGRCSDVVERAINEAFKRDSKPAA